MNNTPVDPKKLKHVSQNSQTTGLIVELFVGNSYNTLSMQSGVHVFVDNRTLRVNSLLGFGAPLGMYTYVALEKKVIQSLPYPYSNCVKDVSSKDGYGSRLFQALIAANYSYNQENCYNLYIQEQVIETCGCFYTIFMNVDSNAEPCLGTERYKCVSNVTRNLAMSDFKAKIQNECPLECDGE
jgi:hypothetical protein